MIESRAVRLVRSVDVIGDYFRCDDIFVFSLLGGKIDVCC